jgi:hypothetical protein
MASSAREPANQHPQHLLVNIAPKLDARTAEELDL